jgi:hypothetical protein
VYGLLEELAWKNTRFVGFPLNDCRAVNLTAIPHNLYVPDTNLVLSNNRITTVYSGAFSRLSGVKLLDLLMNDIKTLEPGCFDGLVSLYTLLLSNNKLNVGNLSPGTFSGLSTLNDLDLHNNCGDHDHPKQYPDRALADLGSLIYLAIDAVPGQQLSNGFGKLRSLLYFWLSCNGECSYL